MKQVDRYYYFLFNALSEANKDPVYRYFFDSEKGILIMKRAECVNDGIADNWEELPKLTYKVKKDFLKSFFNKQKKSFEKELDEIINDFSENSNFNLSGKLKKIHPGLAFEFEMKSGSFLHEQIDQLYGYLNLNESLSLDFSDVTP